MLRYRIIAVLLAVAAATAALTLPLYEVTETRSSGQTTVTRHYRVNTLTTRGGTLVPLVCALPVLAVTLTVFSKKLQTPIGVGLLIFVVLAGMSVGLFYLPSALALLIPTIRDRVSTR